LISHDDKDASMPPELPVGKRTVDARNSTRPGPTVRVRSRRVMEEAFFFGADAHRLFAMAHRPDAVPRAVALVVCHPYGEEKQLSYPVLVAFARRAAAGGFPVLRFDARGYGDSTGALEDATVESHVGETLAAARVARERFGTERIVLLGLRFGALVAALAAERDPTCAGLVLWSPVVSGSQYADDMIRKRLFAEVLAKRKVSRADITAELEREGRLEIEGNFLTRRWRDEAAAIELPAAVRTRRGPVLVGALGHADAVPAPLSGLARAFEAIGAPTTIAMSPAQPFWERNAMYDLYLPDDLFTQTERWLDAHWPRGGG
jgi:exosortase A-associated hydrolase 2